MCIGGDDRVPYLFQSDRWKCVDGYGGKMPLRPECRPGVNPTLRTHVMYYLRLSPAAFSLFMTHMIFARPKPRPGAHKKLQSIASFVCFRGPRVAHQTWIVLTRPSPEATALQDAGDAGETVSLFRLVSLANSVYILCSLSITCNTTNTSSSSLDSPVQANRNEGEMLPRRPSRNLRLDRHCESITSRTTYWGQSQQISTAKTHGQESLRRRGTEILVLDCPWAEGGLTNQVQVHPRGSFFAIDAQSFGNTVEVSSWQDLHRRHDNVGDAYFYCSWAPNAADALCDRSDCLDLCNFELGVCRLCTSQTPLDLPSILTMLCNEIIMTMLGETKWDSSTVKPDITLAIACPVGLPTSRINIVMNAMAASTTYLVNSVVLNEAKLAFMEVSPEPLDNCCNTYPPNYFVLTTDIGGYTTVSCTNHA
ncbi:hypothetical protein EK21DRAFT_92831 [Setomelanomma holmii]|uniref:Uncharacterized protein n=1 Tax=Setomelanomma holmii TaxID=210430 RepID=A0A9P4LI72_9PLEO|nr:hypothetical protein EK21DRAFT_92831 [Setomelanomma holmii]